MQEQEAQRQPGAAYKYKGQKKKNRIKKHEQQQKKIYILFSALPFLLLWFLSREKCQRNFHLSFKVFFRCLFFRIAFLVYYTYTATHVFHTTNTHIRAHTHAFVSFRLSFRFSFIGFASRSCRSGTCSCARPTAERAERLALFFSPCAVVCLLFL